MEEKNIILSDCHNIPGIKQMYYCFKSSVVNMGYPRRVNQWRINNIELQEGKKLGQLFFIDGEVNFVESPTDTAHGDVYNSKASGQIVSTDELLNSILLGISRNEIILFIEDEKNNLRVVGNKQRGVRLKINTTSNVVSGGLFGYGFSFEYISDEPAYWYAGEIVVEDGVPELEEPEIVLKYEYKHDWQEPYSYVGKAIEGTSEGSSWTITRIEVFEDGTTNVKTATGSWTNRATLTYI